MPKHLLRVRGRAPREFANESEVNEQDQAALASPSGREEGLAEDEALSDFEAEVQAHRPGGRPRSEITGHPEPGTPDENEDGLDPTERGVQEAAEEPVRRNKEVGR